MIQELINKGFESDPLKAWKKLQERESASVRLKSFIIKYLLIGS